MFTDNCIFSKKNSEKWTQQPTAFTESILLTQWNAKLKQSCMHQQSSSLYSSQQQLGIERGAVDSLDQLDVVGRNHALMPSPLYDAVHPALVNHLVQNDVVVLQETRLIIVLCLVVVYGYVHRTLHITWQHSIITACSMVNWQQKEYISIGTDTHHTLGFCIAGGLVSE